MLVIFNGGSGNEGVVPGVDHLITSFCIITGNVEKFNKFFDEAM